jgi:uncharacterized repeat protein (TIGR03803 family)
MGKIYLIVCTIILSVNSYAQNELWGVSTYGGNQYGTIYSFATGSNTISSQFDFIGPHMGISSYGELVLASNGKMYGMTQGGGIYGYGTIFEYDPTTAGYAKKYDFATATGGYPFGKLIEVSNGIFYGMTTRGGLNDLGTVFEYNLNTNVYTKKIDFDGFGKGSKPFGSLLKASNGKLYGCTSEGGSQYAGTLFELDITTNSFQKKVEFAGNSGSPYNAGTPRGHLIQASNSKLYGLSYDGGNQGIGAIFEYDIIADTCITVYSFNGSGNGKYPYGSLMEASNGKLYGTTHEGGLSNSGVIFEFDFLSQICTNKFNFHTNGGNPGTDPRGNLIQAPDGNLYGMTYGGGVSWGMNLGVLFKFNIATSSYSKMMDFNFTDGALPWAGLINGPGNKLYGITVGGGISHSGVLFDYDPVTNLYTKKFDFSDAINGQTPQGGLMRASNGKLYGMTITGGVYNGGTLYEFDPVTRIHTKKFDFVDSYGLTSRPNALLIEALPGKLYGVTPYGSSLGSGFDGIIFEYNFLTDTFIEKFAFPTTGQFGFSPNGSLFKHSNGKLYGTTYGGGTNNEGTLFEYDLSTASVTTLTNFAVSNGRPVSSPIEAPNGRLYGLANNIAYHYDPVAMTYSLMTGFGITPGAPTGQLTLAPNGYMYGLNTNGGIGGVGAILRFNPTTNGYNKVADFSSNFFNIMGKSPHGTLSLAPDGNLYGVTTEGGLYNYGVIFKFDPSNNTLNKVFDFNGINGRTSFYTQFLSPCQSLININGPVQLCSGSGQSVFYNVPLSVGSTYTWTSLPGVLISGNPNSNSITLNLSGLSVGIYTLSLSSTNACSMSLSSSLTLTVNPASSLPTVSISGNTNVCEGSSVTFTASGVNTYTWSEGITNPVFNTIPVSNTTYSVMGEDLNNCIVTETIAVTVNQTCTDVWPGDANSDGVADNLDVLELGLHYTQTGTPRANTSNNWQSYYSNSWTGTITNGKNLNHSDCNGDGTINDDDTLAIFNNYGLTHTFKPAQTNSVNPQLSIVPDQAAVLKGTWGTASIYLGDANTNINNINGLAFTIDFDNSLIETNSAYIEYQNSFIDAGQNLHFRKLDFANGKIYTATTHTINNNVNGYGKIATLHYQIKSILTSAEVLNIGISQANQSDASGTISLLTSSTSSLTATIDVGLQEFLNSSIIFISPNPTNGSLTINSKTELQKIEVVSITGALLLSESPTNVSHTLHLQNFANGIYFVNVYQYDRIVKREKIVLNK